MQLTLVRFAYLPDRTLGTLHVDGSGLRIATLERPWIVNPLGPGGKPRESCIPDGAYSVRPYSSARFPSAYIISSPTLGVWQCLDDRPPGVMWGRSEILIHAGNKVEEVIGCIAVGLRHGDVEGQLGVKSSRVALDKLRQGLGGESHHLTIRVTLGTHEKMPRAAA